MPFTRPSLSDLVGRVSSDFRGRLGIAGTLVRRAMADVFGAVWGGAVHMLHGHLAWLALQQFSDTSDDDVMLHEASLYGITPTPATFASGTVSATGVDTSVIPADTILQRGDGVTYQVTADATISGTTTVSVQAVDAGAAGDLAAGQALTFESPITGVDSSVTVTGSDGISGGFDQELPAGTRRRLLLRKQEPPEGGADQDYEAWALAVAGVTRAWVYPNEDGLGTVVVRFVLDGLVDIFPDGGMVTAVQTALVAQRPITAEVTAAAPTAHAVNFEIAVTPNTSAVQAAVAAELADLLFREAAPSDGAGRGTIKLSHIITAIGVADGVTDFTLVSPVANVVPTLGQLATVGTFTWD